MAQDKLLDMLSVSNYYGVEPLKEACGRALGEQVTQDNVAQFIELADRYSSSHLRQACVKVFVWLLMNDN